MTEWVIGIDVGGSHVTGGCVEVPSRTLDPASVARIGIDPGITAEAFLQTLVALARQVLGDRAPGGLRGVGISMPGPFDYARGVGRLRGVRKLDALFGLDVRQTLAGRLGLKGVGAIRFLNDAACYVMGECRLQGRREPRVIGVTLGTGLGSVFLIDGVPVEGVPGVPLDGVLFDKPFDGRMANDSFSTLWLVSEFERQTGERLRDAKALAERAATDARAAAAFDRFGRRLADFLAPFVRDFAADALVIGGSIARAHALFLPAITDALEGHGLRPTLLVSRHFEEAAIHGAASLFGEDAAEPAPECDGRRSTQELLPARKPPQPDLAHDIYPAFSIGPGKIAVGVDALADALAGAPRVTLDGFAGVWWDDLQQRLDAALRARGVATRWYGSTPR